MMEFYRTLKGLAIWHEPLWLWLIKRQYGAMERKFDLAIGAW